MTQYLLAVHMVEGQELPTPDVSRGMYADVDAVNAEIQAAGAWVFAGGLHPANVRRSSSRRGTARSGDGRAVRQDEGAARRVLGNRRGRPRRRPRLGCQGNGGVPGADRGAAVPGRGHGRGRDVEAPGSEAERAAVEHVFRDQHGATRTRTVRLGRTAHAQASPFVEAVTPEGDATSIRAHDPAAFLRRRCTRRADARVRALSPCSPTTSAKAERGNLGFPCAGNGGGRIRTSVG